MIDLNPALEPSVKELRALAEFASCDETRASLARVWTYRSDGGVSFIATDGYTLALRRAGTHRSMTLSDIARLEPTADGFDFKTAQVWERPPPWQSVIKVPVLEGTAPCERHSVNCAYLARIDLVERAAADRKAVDLVRATGEAMKRYRTRQDDARRCVMTLLTIPTNDRDGWFWTIDTPAALWEGMIMPRRVK